METVVFGGVTYSKAATAAKRFNYTSDYVGQLCRDKKIDARLIGRSWYVNMDSIADYRKAKHSKRKVKSAEKKQKKGSKDNGFTPVKISSVSRHKPPTPMHAEAVSSAKKLSVRYEDDESALMPALGASRAQDAVRIVDAPIAEESISSKPNKPPTPAKLPSVTIKVASTDKKQATLVADPLPQVELSGDVPVVTEMADIPESARVPAVDDESISEKKSKKRSKIWSFVLFLSMPILLPFKLLRWIVRPFWRVGVKIFKKLVQLGTAFLPVFKKTTKSTKAREKTTISQPITKKTAVGFTPKKVLVRPDTVHHDRVRFWSLVASAVLTSLLILSVGSEVSVVGETMERNIYFDRDVVGRIFAR